jgi:GR25 family glycosyltransferase involved in LPS biosynthesis
MPEQPDNYPLRGSYINLDRSPERRALCEQQLLQQGLTPYYQRLAGVDGKLVHINYPSTKFSPAKLGCWLSHLNAIEQGVEHDHHHHILEDDFQFTPAFRSFAETLDHQLAKLESWDILFTDVDLAGMHQVQAMRDLIATINKLATSGEIVLRDAVNLYAAGNSSYIINRASKHKVLELMKPGLQTQAPNDIYLRQLIRNGQLKAFVTLPFVTTVDAGFSDSTILGSIGQTNPSILLATQFRRSLACQAETRAILDTVKKQINQLRPISDRGMIYAHLAAHFVSDDYKPY